MDVDLEQEPLDWWEKHQNTFPKLSALAQVYHGIPATSASSEIAFSTAGGFTSAKRSRLNPRKLNQLCVIHAKF